jgi:D-alanine-D-alanine ligase
MKKNIAIIMGGYSTEAHISLKSGEVVYEQLPRERYNPYRVHILEEGWILLDDDGNHHPVNRHDFSVMIGDEKIVFDAVFNAIHGHPGEDGPMIAYLEMLNIPHTSPPSYQLGLTFNKKDCLSVVRDFGIKTADSYVVRNGEPIDTDIIEETVGIPCFVKPNCAGSSFGISRVDRSDQLLPAVKKAFEESPEVLVETFLDGTEVTVGVLRYKGEVLVLPMTEIVSHNSFFDYEAKYLGASEEITPARISESVQQRIATDAEKIYTTLNMRGITRSEFIVVDDVPHFLEMNTVPGMTEASLIPQQAAAAGISLSELFHNAIELAQKT